MIIDFINALIRAVSSKPFPKIYTGSLKILAFAICLAAFLFSAQSVSAQDGAKRQSLAIVTSSGAHKFNVEVAATRVEQARGLMFRRSMARDNGMLFVYAKTQYVSMWMRNTYISLDMIFILPSGRVHRIEAATEPHSERIIDSGERVSAVLELLAGTAARIGLKAGDTIRHSQFKPE